MNKKFNIVLVLFVTVALMAFALPPTSWDTALAQGTVPSPPPELPALEITLIPTESYELALMSLPGNDCCCDTFRHIPTSHAFVLLVFMSTVVWGVILYFTRGNKKIVIK